MTTLTNIGLALNIPANLENRILHDWNNGGTTSTYGLDVGQRKKLIRILLLENPKCNCLECIQAPAPMSVVADIINLLNKRKEVKMTSLKTYCQGCGKDCGKISVYDAPYAGEPTCWECIFNSCNICYGQGMTGWVSPDGDFDFEYCECNPLCLTLEEVK